MLKRIWIILLLAAVLAGCGTAEPQTTLTPTASQPAPAITPYQTDTPVQPSGPTATPAPTSTLPPLPTATPYMHTIVENNTLIGIANYYGVTVDEILVANPGIDPNFLSVGAQIIIPLPEGETGGENVSTEPDVLALETSPATCYRVRTEGWWCFMVVTNPLEQPAENIAALLRLFDESGQETASQAVAGLVNVLPPGESLPLAAYFPPPVETWSEAQGQLVSAAAANQVAQRYLNIELGEVTTTPLADDQLGMEVSGSLRLGLPEAGSAAVDYLWILAAAYDADGAVVGLRRWEAAPEQIAGEVTFSFQVYSLGKPIARVELLTEARAIP